MCVEIRNSDEDTETMDCQVMEILREYFKVGIPSSSCHVQICAPDT